jgi:hypothetical protein
VPSSGERTITYVEPRTLVSSTASTPARSTGRARAGLSRSTTAPHRSGSAGPTGAPGARPANASQTFIRVSTYVTQLPFRPRVRHAPMPKGE